MALLVGVAGCSEDDPLDFGQPRNCSIPAQNEWVYGLMQEAYLWNEHVPSDVDPARYESPSDLVSELRYAELDRWSRVSDLETTEALFEEGKVIGLGFRTRRVDDHVELAFVDPLSPAGVAGLRRGDRLAGIGDLSAAQLDADDSWSDAFGPNEPGVTVALQMAAESPETTREVVVTKDWYPLVTVPYAQVQQHGGRPVGYLFFTTFVEPSVEELDRAFAEFAEAGVREVVLDLRYNGGGRVSTARHLMNLLVGATAPGQVAYRTEYAPALSDADTARELEAKDASLPALEHVVFITTGSTASASELVINGVTPYVAVSVVGSVSAGKPVGSAQWEFCDQVALPITFRLLNAQGRGDYFGGFALDCEAQDDLGFDLGDPQEAAMQAALARLDHAPCPAPADEAEDEDEGEGEASGPPPGLRAGHTGSSRPPLRGAYPGLDELRERY